MKPILTMVYFVFITFAAAGQICGKYTIEYVGHIDSDSLEIIGIKFPTPENLHYLKSGESAYVLSEVNKGFFNKNTYSYLTHHLYDDPNQYLKLFSEKRNHLPVIVLTKEKEATIETTIEIPWDTMKLRITKNNANKLVTQLDLGLLIVN